MQEAKRALAELEGYQLLAKGEIGPAFDSFAKARPMRTESLARAQLRRGTTALPRASLARPLTRTRTRFLHLPPRSRFFTRLATTRAR